jgi:hypothetical protein
MDVGQPIRKHIVEPIENPVPQTRAEKRRGRRRDGAPGAIDAEAAAVAVILPGSAPARP